MEIVGCYLYRHLAYDVARLPYIVQRYMHTLKGDNRQFKVYPHHRL